MTFSLSDTLDIAQAFDEKANNFFFLVSKIVEV